VCAKINIKANIVRKIANNASGNVCTPTERLTCISTLLSNLFSASKNNPIWQCCATFLHSRHTKYCRRVTATHQPHFAYCGGGGDGCVTFQFHLVDLVCPTKIKKMKTETEQKTRWTIIYLIMIIIIMRGEHFVAHLDGLGGRPVCRWTPVAHHCDMTLYGLSQFINSASPQRGYFWNHTLNCPNMASVCASPSPVNTCFGHVNPLKSCGNYMYHTTLTFAH
jgi:hypothetical protein